MSTDAKDANPIADMPLAALLDYLEGLDTATFQDINRCYSRLVAIGLFEHGYSDADRDKALGIADTVKVQILRTLAGHPELIDEFEQAAAMQIGQARYHGIGSSDWIAEEERVRRAEGIA